MLLPCGGYACLIDSGSGNRIEPDLNKLGPRVVYVLKIFYEICYVEYPLAIIIGSDRAGKKIALNGIVIQE
jgi:hypothetical protein